MKECEQKMMDYAEDRRILKQAIEENRLVVFVGAGVSFNSGIPLWNTAVEQINDKLETALSVENDVLKIPQIYYNERGQKEYFDLIQEIFKYKDKEINKLHERIVKLRPYCIITTNYDDFIERAFIKNGEFLDVIEKDSDIAYSRNNRMIIKMHGSFKQENIVLKEDDYLNYSENFPLIETFVKALVAKNIVLFIGYSYNDSDTRQIFGWVKNILGNNFQRSYYLDANSNFDLALNNYYKNLGINSLYARECAQIVCTEGEIYENTIKFLDFIIEDVNETDVESIVYTRARYFEDLNYILSQYIPLIFSGTRVNVTEGFLYADDPETEKLFTSLNDEKAVAESKKLSTIRSTLNKTKVMKACIREEHSFKSKVLCNFDSVQNDEIYDYIDKQNFLGLQKHIDSVQTDINNQEKMKIAYGLLQLGDYKKCYESLKNISTSSKQQQNYVDYFLSEFNRLHVAEIWNLREYLNSNQWLRSEIKAIDLSDILYSNFGKGKNENKYLRDLESFSLMYVTLTKVTQISYGVEKDTATNFIGGCASGKIDLLEDTIRDFYNYLKYNHLMIDGYSEVKAVFKQYIDASLYSHSKEEKETQDEVFSSGKNIVLKEVSPLFVIILCKYIDKSTLSELIEKNGIKKIILNKEATEVLFEILNNYKEAIENKIEVSKISDKILVIMEIISFANIESEKFKLTFNILSSFIERDVFTFTDYRELNKVIITLYRNNSDIFVRESVVGIIEAVCKGFEKKNWDEVELKYVKILFGNLSHIQKNLFPEEIMEDCYSDIVLNKRYVDILPDLFLIASEKQKMKIKDQIDQELKKEDFNPELYCDAVNAKIILKSNEYENRLFEEVQKLYDIKSNSVGRSFPDNLENILIDCINLFLSDNLFSCEKLEPYLKEYPNLEFIYDMENFDYEKFKISWFEKQNEGLKKQIVENKCAKEKIKRIYQEAFKSNDYNESMITNYFEYLVDDDK